jgi:ferredoxin
MSASEWMPRIDRNLCTGCKACVETCPTNALAQVGGKAALAHPERCIYCLACEDVCPVKAIELPFLIQVRGEGKV